MDGWQVDKVKPLTETEVVFSPELTRNDPPLRREPDHAIICINLVALQKTHSFDELRLQYPAKKDGIA